ncbi:MAG: hypothetical protein ABEI80_07065 [Haloplanus sp.]
MSGWRRFPRVALGLGVVVFVVAATVAPPDPYTQLLVVVPGLVCAVVVAYWVTVRGGREGS